MKQARRVMVGIGLLGLAAGGCSNTSTSARTVTEDPEAAKATTARTTETATPTSTSTASTGETQLTYYNFARGVLAQACVPCHGSTPSEGAPDTFRLDVYDDVGGVAGVGSKLARIQVRVADETMPPAAGTITLSASDKQNLIAWGAAGGAKGTAAEAAAAASALPSLHIVAPADAGESVTAGSYTVELEFANLPAAATYSVFHTTTSGATSGGTRFVAGATSGGTRFVNAAAPAVTSQTLTTTALANATHHIYMTVSGTSLAVASVGSITVFNNSSPSVALTGNFKNGNTAITMPADITYTSSDPDGDSLSYKFEYSLDGTNWTTIADNVTTPSPYSWDPGGTDLPTEGEKATYRVRITATDGNSGSASDTSSAVFALTTIAYTYTGQVQAILSGYCHACHNQTNGGQKNAFTYDIYSTGSIGALQKHQSIATRSSAETMPPGGGVSAADKVKLKIWSWQGANQ